MTSKLANVFRNFGTKAGTVDSSEIKHFKEMAPGWWDLNGGAIGLHRMNNLRVPLIENRLKAIGVIPQEDSPRPLKKLSFLDVGCGAGIFTEALNRKGCVITGLDATPELTQVAKMHAEAQKLVNIEYVCSSIEEFSEQHKEQYNVLVASEIIEHVTEKEQFIRACIQCLKPGGSIFFTTFNRTWMAALICIYGYEYVFRCIPIGTHQYNKFIDVNDMVKLLKKENCETVYTSGIVYNPIFQKWHLIRNYWFSYVLHGVKNG